MEASTSAAALQKSFSRRVSFKEDKIIPVKVRRCDYDSDHGTDIESRRRRASEEVRGRIEGPVWNSCCFWISIAIGLLLFLIILLGGIYYGFLKSHLPSVRILRLDVSRINVVPANKDAAVTADLAVLLEVANGEDETELIYRNMIASVVASGVQFGVVRLADMRQPPANATHLVVAGVVKGVVMDDWAARDLRSSAETHVLMIDVNVKGRIDMVVGGKKMHGFPFRIECRSVNQTTIDGGWAPGCSTQLSPLR